MHSILCFPPRLLSTSPRGARQRHLSTSFSLAPSIINLFELLKAKAKKGGPQQTKATPLVDAASRFEPAVVVAVHPVRPGGRLGLAGAESFAPVPSCTVTTTGSTGRVETCKGGTERTHTSISATFESARPKGVPGVLNRHVSPYLHLTPYGHT
jgi:hypothetical protein